MVERPITTNSKCKDLMIANRRCLLMKDSKFEQKVSNIQWENFGIIFRKKICFPLTQAYQPPFWISLTLTLLWQMLLGYQTTCNNII